MKTSVRLWSAFNAAANYTGQALSYIPPAVFFLATALGSVYGGQADIQIGDYAVVAGASAVGLGIAAAGYGRIIGSPNKEGAERGKLAHAFNFVASNIGAGISSIAALATYSMIVDGAVSHSPGEFALATIATLGGLALFAAGHGRKFGKPQASTADNDPAQGAVVKPPENEPKL